MGRLFGHGFVRTVPRQGEVQKGEKRRVGVGVGEGAQGATPLFFRFSQICIFQPLNILTLFSKETAASTNIPKTRMQSAFGETDKRTPFKNNVAP